MIGRYTKGAEYEFQNQFGITRRLKLVRSTWEFVWFVYNTEKTRRVLKVNRKDKRWKERLSEVKNG